MCIDSIPNPYPTLHPVLRRHLLHLAHGSITLRSLHRNDLPAWRRLCEQRHRGCAVDCGPDADVQVFIGIQRSRLQQDNDQLLLGVFDHSSHELLDQIGVRLQSTLRRSAELQPFCPVHWHDPERFGHTLQALCPFLFEQVGLQRVYMMLPPRDEAGLAKPLQALGFQNEGLLRDHHPGMHGWEDRHMYALTAPVWRRRQRLPA
ncbi:GNAT family N-acetyltransferase [Stenotrophomonas maltophilia]|uniref:GNAT family N-acetyltransferase n=1 Tax=Stenotrophomonas maltophilia TaxID=40324 RepID=UPI0039F6F88B